MEGKILKLKEGAIAGDVGRVAHLLNQLELDWNMDKLKTLFDEATIEEIRKIDLSQCLGEDKLLWIASKSGIFSSRSAFNLLAEADEEATSIGIWKDIWHSKIHERLKLFLWRLTFNYLPTKINIRNRIQKGRRGLCPLQGGRRDCYPSFH